MGRCAGPKGKGPDVSDDGKSRPLRLRRERQPNVPGGRQGRHVVKTTPEEELALLRRAADARVTVARLMVESALADGAETATDRREFAHQLFGAFRLLSTMSNNINQIAKGVNAGGELPAELSATLAAVRRLATRIDGILDGLSAP